MKGLRIERPSMVRPWCMSSEYRIVQPASCAAAMINPSKILTRNRSASARPFSCVSKVTGTTSLFEQIIPMNSRSSSQVNPSLRRATDVNSFSTWTLTIPPPASKSRAAPARAGSWDVTYKRMFVSKNGLASLFGPTTMRLLPIELEISRQATLEFPQPVVKLTDSGLPFHFKNGALALAPRDRPQFDFVALSQPELRDEFGRQPDRQTVSPSRDLHRTLPDIHRSKCISRVN